jgi:hypothetical protein
MLAALEREIKAQPPSNAMPAAERDKQISADAASV